MSEIPTLAVASPLEEFETACPFSGSVATAEMEATDSEKSPSCEPKKLG